jgi:hypothetical protein
MAAAHVASRPVPLETTTNSPSGHPYYPKTLGFPSSPTRSKPLRRIDSLRAIHHKDLGSDSPKAPGSPDSIYNAERVDSAEISPSGSAFRLPPPAFPLETIAPQNQEHSRQHNDGLIRSLSTRSPPLGHSNWPEPLLDTIIERSSTRSLRQSASAPRLQSSPERSAFFVKPQSSIHSVRAVRHSSKSPWPREKPLPEIGVHHQHSFSMTDLDCLKRLKEELYSPVLCPTGTLTPQSPMFPVKPRHPPPQQPATPEGLPAFGSQEAQQLRLTLPSERKLRPRILQRWLRGDHESEEHPSATSSNAVISPVTSATVPVASAITPPEETGSLERIKQIFGISKPVTAPDPSGNPNPKAALPAGVTLARSPGVLAVAEDSTPIRGRFGARASGHGVGTRSLDVHPLVRPRGQAAIEEQVREIDKACARMNSTPERNHLEQPPQFPSIDSELQRQVPPAPRDVLTRPLRPGNATPASLTAPSFQRPNTPRLGPADTSPVMSSNTLDPSFLSSRQSRSNRRSGSSSMRMREPR